MVQVPDLDSHVIFYSGTLALLTIIHSILDLCLYAAKILHPIYALIGSLHFICGWVVQVSWWTTCELHPSVLGDGPYIGCLNENTATGERGAENGRPIRVSAAKIGSAGVLLLL